MINQSQAKKHPFIIFSFVRKKGDDAGLGIDGSVVALMREFGSGQQRTLVISYY